MAGVFNDDDGNPLTAEDIDTLFKHQKDEKWKQKFNLYKAEKLSLMDKIFTVVDGPEKKRVESKWKVVEDISAPDKLTTKPVAQDDIGIICLDFEELMNADYPLVEIFL